MSVKGRAIHALRQRLARIGDEAVVSVGSVAKGESSGGYVYAGFPRCASGRAGSPVPTGSTIAPSSDDDALVPGPAPAACLA